MILALGDDLAAAWSAPTTTDKDRKHLLRSLLDEVNISVHRDTTAAHAELLLRWKGGRVSAPRPALSHHGRLTVRRPHLRVLRYVHRQRRQ